MANIKNKTSDVVKIVIPCIEWCMAVFCVYFAMTRGFDSMPLTWIFNVSADLICILISLFLIMGIIIGADTIDKRNAEFLLICHAGFLSLIMDYASWMMDGVIESRGIILFINTTLYISNLCLTAAYARFIIDSTVEPEKRRNYYYILYSLLAVTIMTRLMNIKFGYFFVVSADGVYSRGPLHFVSYDYTVFVQLLVIFILIKSDISRAQKRAVFAFTILPFAASIVSIFVYGLSLMYACVLISIVMIYSAFFVELEEDKGKLIENFEKYISNDIVQKIVDNPGKKLIEGRKYSATVLITDIRGFTALSDIMQAQDLVDMLNHYFGEISEIINSFGGVVTEFLGDGIMCIFGAPKTRDDHADAAVAAALKIQEAADGINDWNRQHNYPPVYTGIGINTGTMVLGSLGSETHAKYTAVGQAIDRAIEVESCSIGGQVLVSHSTLRAVKSRIDEEYLCDYVPDPNQLVKIQIHEISHIYGTWNVGRKRMLQPVADLKKPVELECCVIDGKIVDIKNYKGSLLGISSDCALISTEAPLNALDNVQITIHGKGSIYAKVYEISNSGIKFIFTSGPDFLNDWIKTII